MRPRALPIWRAATAARVALARAYRAVHVDGIDLDAASIERAPLLLRPARAMLTDHGCVLIRDERTADQFLREAGEVERLYYGFSVLHRLPVGMVGDDAVGTGTVMRIETVRHYASEAGCTSFEVLPIENDFWRFYLLAP